LSILDLLRKPGKFQLDFWPHSIGNALNESKKAAYAARILAIPNESLSKKPFFIEKTALEAP